MPASRTEKQDNDQKKVPRLEGLFTSFRANTPWLYLDIDRDAVKTGWACP